MDRVRTYWTGTKYASLYSSKEASMLNQEQIRGNWKEIMGGIRNLWGNITEEELAQTQGNIQAVSSIVQERYGESTTSIQEKLGKLLDSFDNDTNRNFIRNDHQTSYQRNPTSVRNSATSQNQDTISDISTRSGERQVFENSEGGAINTKQGIAGNKPAQSSAGSYGTGLSTGAGATDKQDSTLHDIDFNLDDMGGEDEDQSIEAENQGLDKSRFNHGINHKEDRIARH